MWCELLTKTKLFKTVMKWKSSWSAAEVFDEFSNVASRYASDQRGYLIRRRV